MIQFGEKHLKSGFSGMPCGCGYCLQRVKERQNSVRTCDPGGWDFVCVGRFPAHIGGTDSKETDERNKLWGRNS